MATGRAADTVLTVQRFLQQVQKQAGKYEPGSVGSATEHISGKVDGNTFDKQEGEHSEDNNKDVKKQVGPAAIVGEGEGKKKEAIDSIPTPGLREAATGEDPENETSRAKRVKDDNAGKRLGRTTHIARADNRGIDKIAYDEMSIDEHVKVAADLGNRLVAALSVASDEPASTPASVKQAQASQVDEAAQVGWELAGLVDSTFDKQAGDQYALALTEQLIKSALDDAENVTDFLASYYNAAAEQAAPVKTAAPVKVAAPVAPRNRPAPVAKRAMAMPPGAGGPPPEASAPAPTDAEPAPGEEVDGGGGSEEELMAMLEQAAAEQGVSVQEFISSILGGEAGGEAGGEPAPGAAPGMEVAASQKTAATKRPGAAKTAEEATRNYIRELLDRSRS